MSKKFPIFFLYGFIFIWVIATLLILRFRVNQKIPNSNYPVTESPQIIDGSMYVNLHLPKSPNVEAIKMVSKFIDSFRIDGFSDFLVINVNSQIPYQPGDKKSPLSYPNINTNDHTEDDGSITVSLFTWTKDDGMLANWKVNVANGQISHIFAQVVDVGVGHCTLRTEGFLPIPGTILINSAQ
jgi:hypothetical protein